MARGTKRAQQKAHKAPKQDLGKPHKGIHGGVDKSRTDADQMHREGFDREPEQGIATLSKPGEFEDRRNHNIGQVQVSWRIQPYDPNKGFDLSKYDLRYGEPGNPAVPNPHAFKVAPAPGNQSTGLCVECGKGVAPGQNYLCREHIRMG